MTDTTKDSFGLRLKAIMARKGMTIRQLSIRSGLGYASVHGYTTKAKTGALPSIENLSALAKALDVTVDELMGHAPRITPPPLSPEQKAILETMEALTPEDRAMILQMAKRIKKGE